jgi:hypothetical protein
MGTKAHDAPYLASHIRSAPPDVGIERFDPPYLG